MKTAKPIIDDLVIREIRAARGRLWKEGGGTFEGFQRVVAERVGRIARSLLGKKGRAVDAQLEKRESNPKRRRKVKRSEANSS
jgi:hypothetical protein